MNNREIIIDGVMNVRDLGGLKTTTGKSIAPKRFIRGAAIHKISEAGKKKFDELPVGLVLDLRSTIEATKYPDNIADEKIEYYHLPMLDHIQSNTELTFKLPASLEELYINILEEQKKEFMKAFEIIASNPQKTVFYHCTAGKDRTGLLSMLLLGISDVPDDEIVGDYALTKPFRANEEKKVDLPEFLFQAPPEVMIKTIEWINKNYGGIKKYVDEIGVTKAAQEEILSSAGIL